MPIEREVLLRRIEYLRDVQRSLEHGIEIAIGFVLASPIINLFVRAPQMFLLIAIGITIVIAFIGIAMHKIQVEIRRLWGEVMRRDPWWERIPVIAVAGIVACIVSIVAILLTW